MSLGGLTQNKVGGWHVQGALAQGSLHKIQGHCNDFWGLPALRGIILRSPAVHSPLSHSSWQRRASSVRRACH